MITQTDKRLNPINTWGCYYISLVNLASLITGKDYEPKTILENFMKDYKEGDTDIEATCINPSGILQEYGINLTYIGWQPADYATQPNEYEILEFYNKDTNIVHFVLGDGKGKVLFDPYPNSNTVRNGYLRSKRIFRR